MVAGMGVLHDDRFVVVVEGVGQRHFVPKEREGVFCPGDADHFWELVPVMPDRHPVVLNFVHLTTPLGFLPQPVHAATPVTLGLSAFLLASATWPPGRAPA